MQIELQDIAKKFNKEWIFRNLNLCIPSGTKLAVLGSNGSGKSTLLQIILGSLSPNHGKIIYTKDNFNIEVEQAYKYFSIATPYLELVEEMTLNEMINYHFSFKRRLQNISNKELIDLVGLKHSEHKEIRHYSSGMRQRVKLLLSMLSDVDCILLDEPCSNLDVQGIQWYKQLLEDYLLQRTLIICSNQTYEYEICDKNISIMDFKPQSQK